MSTTTAAKTDISLRWTGEARVEASVDIVEFFTRMGERERTRYLTWDPAKDELIGEPCDYWVKPVSYVEAYLCDDVTIEVNGPGVLNLSDFDGWESRPRTEKPQYASNSWKPDWSEAHYAQLVEAVPWLKAAEPADDPEIAAEIERCAPSPWDVPMFDLPEVES